MDILDSIIALQPYTPKICAQTGNEPYRYWNQKYGPDSYCVEIKPTDGGMDTTGCYEMKCSENNELTITFGSSTHKCLRGGDKFSHPTEVTCPDPKIVCGIKKYISSFKTKSNPVNSEPKKDQTKKLVPAKHTPKKMSNQSQSLIEQRFLSQ